MVNNMRTKIFYSLLAFASIGAVLFPGDSGVVMAFIPALVGALVSGGIGMLAQTSANDRAAMLQDQALQEWLKIQIPDPKAQALALERFVQAGELTPELESAVAVSASEMEKISTDPRLRESRMRALSSLEEIGMGGESLEDQAAQERALIEAGTASRGRGEAILSDLARRGQLGSGMEIAARQAANQAEGDRAATTALDIESQRRRRALEALSGAGNLAGDIERDEFGMASDVAQAADKIRLFNAQNAQSVGGRNVDRRNEAMAANLAAKQGVMDRNTGLSNFQQQYNRELEQQRFDNQGKIAAGKTGQLGQNAALATQQGAQAAQMWGNVASGLGNVAASAFGSKDKKAQGGGSMGDDLEDEELNTDEWLY